MTFKEEIDKLIIDNQFIIYEYYKTRENASFEHFPVFSKFMGITNEYNYSLEEYTLMRIETDLFTLVIGSPKCWNETSAQYSEIIIQEKNGI